MQTDTHISSSETIIYSKVKSFFKLTKFTLSALVVFSAIITFFTVAETYNWKQVLAICLGGFLVTAAANGFNQIIEKDLDKLMHRTKLRPIPTGNLTVNQAFIICAIFGVVGTIMLWVFTNPLSGIIGFVSIILYALGLYTFKARYPILSICWSYTRSTSYFNWCCSRYGWIWTYILFCNIIILHSIFLAIPPFLGYCLGKP